MSMHFRDLVDRAEAYEEADLRASILVQIERAVIGEARITAATASLLRRAIYGPAHVGRAEVEMLFRLKDATLAARNAPAWKQLFVEGVADYLESAQEFDAVLARPSRGLGRLLDRMARADVVEGYCAAFDTCEGIDREITGNDWLQARLEADGGLDEYERALLDFLAEA